jgi:hypothetical protein
VRIFCIYSAEGIRDIDLLSRPPPLLPTPFTPRDETISPVPSRKRHRHAYVDELVPSAVTSLYYQLLVYRQSDDADSEREDSEHLCASDVPGTGKDQPPVQSDPDDDGVSDSETRESSDEKGRKGLPLSPRPPRPPRTTGKPSRKPRAVKGLEKGPEREYFSPSGVKLEVLELPVKYDTREWLKHVEECPEGSKAPWCCTWQTMKNGKRVPCDYSSKKHLVKRHIEATHLCIKYVLTKYGSLFVNNAPCRRFQCTWCEKTFTQRSNVAGCHLNTQYVSCFIPHIHLLNFLALVRPLMGAISAKRVSRTPRRGTNTCCAAMGIVQGRAGRNSGPRSLLRVNLLMNPSSHGKWQPRVNVDVICSSW